MTGKETGGMCDRKARQAVGREDLRRGLGFKDDRFDDLSALRYAHPQGKKGGGVGDLGGVLKPGDGARRGGGAETSRRWGNLLADIGWQRSVREEGELRKK